MPCPKLLPAALRRIKHIKSAKTTEILLRISLLSLANTMMASHNGENRAMDVARVAKISQ